MVDVFKRNNVRIVGDADQAVILAHGFGCDQNVWRFLIKDLSRHYKVIVFDYVGAGKSDLTAYNSERYGSLDGYGQDVIEILEALNPGPAIFIGHSVSSMIGVKAALKRPELFTKMVFVGPSPYYINEEGYTGGLEKEALLGLLDMMESNYLGWSSALAPSIMGNPDRPELAEELEANFCSTDPVIANEFARVTFLSDCRNDLRGLTVPSLSLQCSEDILAPLEVGHYIKENTPGNQLVIMEATGHCPHLSAPDETLKYIRAFIN